MSEWVKPIRIACIVEGDGDADAIPLLVRRIARDLDPPALAEPFLSQRIPKSRLVGKPPHLENAIELAARGAGASGAILLVVDADDDCPATVGPALLQRARKARADVPSAVVLAKREYEAWFLAAAPSLRGLEGFPANLEAPTEPESISDAKGWLTRHMPPGQPYKERLHQLRLTKRFDLGLARSVGSFDKLCRDITALIIAAGRRG
jgi:hypothetical protein